MDRTSLRAWRRIQKKRVWRNRLRIVFRVFAPVPVEYDTHGPKREAASWKELRNVKGFQVYRPTGRPCSCPMCSSEKYNRLHYKRDTKRFLREQLEYARSE